MSSVTVRDEPRGSPFMRIPLELRFAIYEELLAPPSKSERVLCMCDRCQEKKTGRKCANPDKRERAIYPAIMATSKTIHDEAMVILYSKNVFQIVCPEFSTYPTNKRVPETCGTNSLVTSEGGPRSLYMKQVVVSFSCYARDELDNLPHMWSWVEPMTLAYYPGVQRISINLLRVNAPYRVLITMARKDQYSFKAEMAAQKSQNYWDALKLRQCDSNWEVKDLCDTILPAHRSGLFDDSSFAIRSIQWSDSKKSPLQFSKYSCDSHRYVAAQMSREHDGEQTFIAAQDPPNQPSRARSSPSAADSSETEHLPLPRPQIP